MPSLTPVSTQITSPSTPGAFDYSLEEQASNAGKTVADYHLLNPAEINRVMDQLHVTGVTSDQLYVNSKIPFGYNYVDDDLDITHDNDTQGEHGSHVEGIAAANAYIPDGNGGYDMRPLCIRARRCTGRPDHCHEGVRQKRRRIRIRLHGSPWRMPLCWAATQ